MTTSVQITARNEIALTKKHQPAPVVASMIPASAGPVTRLSWTWVEFIAIAFDRSSRGTRSEMIDWRTGTLKALTIPFASAIASTIQTVTRPLRVR